jgi:hypothetical protein
MDWTSFARSAASARWSTPRRRVCAGGIARLLLCFRTSTLGLAVDRKSGSVCEAAPASCPCRMTCEAPGFNFFRGWRSPDAADSGARPPISPLGGQAEKRGEVLDPLHIVMLGFRRELTGRHVFDHASAQWAGVLVGHGDALVLNEVVETPQSQDRALRHAIAFSVPPAAALYRASGLVL